MQIGLLLQHRSAKFGFKPGSISRVHVSVSASFSSTTAQTNFREELGKPRSN